VRRAYREGTAIHASRKPGFRHWTTTKPKSRVRRILQAAHWTKKPSAEKIRMRMKKPKPKGFAQKVMKTKLQLYGTKSGIKMTRNIRRKISNSLKRGYRSGVIKHWTVTSSSNRVRRIFRKMAPKISVSVKKIWKDDAYALPILKKWMQRPNRSERKIIRMRIPKLKYVGDGQFWVRLGKRRKNPDFILKPFSKTRTVVELFGGRGWFHTESEARSLVQAYRRKHIKCILLWDDIELKDKCLIRSKIVQGPQ